jgi:hypothetical protein
MTYSIFDTGNLVVSFDRADEAHAALVRIARQASDPGAVLLVTFDDNGAILEEVAAEAAA